MTAWGYTVLLVVFPVSCGPHYCPYNDLVKTRRWHNDVPNAYIEDQWEGVTTWAWRCEYHKVKHSVRVNAADSVLSMYSW
jgi:hypothetical protein